MVEYIGNSLPKGPVVVDSAVSHLGRLACKTSVHDVYNALPFDDFLVGKTFGSSVSMCPCLDGGGHLLKASQFKFMMSTRAWQPSNHPLSTLKDETPQFELRGRVDAGTLIGANGVCPKPECSIGGSREGLQVLFESSHSRVLDMHVSRHVHST